MLICQLLSVVFVALVLVNSVEAQWCGDGVCDPVVRTTLCFGLRGSILPGRVNSSRNV
jgi:hypothetical protein